MEPSIMRVEFTIDTSSRPDEVRIATSSKFQRTVYPMSPAEAIQLGAILIEAGQHMLNAHDEPKPVFMKNIDIELISRGR